MLSYRQKKHVAEIYNSLPEEVKNNVFKAKRWAQKRLTELEGKGHYISLSRDFKYDKISKEFMPTSKIVCSFAKPSWPGDHSGSAMNTGAEAIIISVLEYEEYKIYD